MRITYPLDTMKRVMQRKAKALAPKDVLKREKARAQREKLVKKLERAIQVANQYGPAVIPQWQREYKFHEERGWRFDLAWPSDDSLKFNPCGWCEVAGVAVEVHGGVYSNGRHTRGKNFIADREKMNEARIMGWLVLEVCDEHIDSGQAIEWIRRALQA